MPDYEEWDFEELAARLLVGSAVLAVMFIVL